jgi:hypothetical protein
MYIKDEGVDWTELTQDRDQWDNAPLVSIKDGGIY